MLIHGLMSKALTSSLDVDLDILLECAKFARSLAEFAPMKDMIGMSFHPMSRELTRSTHISAKEASPGPDVQTDEQLRSRNHVLVIRYGPLTSNFANADFIKDNTNSIFRMVSPCVLLLMLRCSL